MDIFTLSVIGLFALLPFGLLYGINKTTALWNKLKKEGIEAEAEITTKVTFRRYEWRDHTIEYKFITKTGAAMRTTFSLQEYDKELIGFLSNHQKGNKIIIKYLETDPRKAVPVDILLAFNDDYIHNAKKRALRKGVFMFVVVLAVVYIFNGTLPKKSFGGL